MRLPTLLAAVLVVGSRPVASQEPYRAIASTLGVVMSGTPNDRLFGAQVAVSVETVRWDTRFAVEGSGALTGCPADYLSRCGDYDGLYYDLSVARRWARHQSPLSAWHVGAGGARGPHDARYLAAFLERQQVLGQKGLARLGVRYRHGVRAEPAWYGAAEPRLWTIYTAVGMATGGRSSERLAVRRLSSREDR